MRTLLFSTAFFDIVTDILLKVSGSIWKDLMFDGLKSKKWRIEGKKNNQREKEKIKQKDDKNDHNSVEYFSFMYESIKEKIWCYNMTYTHLYIQACVFTYACKYTNNRVRTHTTLTSK